MTLPPPDRSVLLVGAGVVGCAIAQDHLRHGIPVWISDRDESALRRALHSLAAGGHGEPIDAVPWGTRLPLPVVGFIPIGGDADPLSGVPLPRWIVIESIAERLDVKREFFASAETWFDAPPILTSNTSTLRISEIASAMKRPEWFLGLHFFMPVVGRDAAEVIPHAGTSSEFLAPVQRHVSRLNKNALVVGDAPGFVVNRLLVPYLNLSLHLVCGGVSFETLRFASHRLGMPMSPLELIDLIGTRTAFDGGRVVWQAFPDRVNPSPLLPALIKRGFAGLQNGRGFYQYENGRRTGDEPRPEIVELIQRYARPVAPPLDVNDVDEIAARLGAAIAQEVQTLIADGVADGPTVVAAIQGGLGCEAGLRTGGERRD